jgi:hypothetical protein
MSPIWKKFRNHWKRKGVRRLVFARPDGLHRFAKSGLHAGIQRESTPTYMDASKRL